MGSLREIRDKNRQIGLMMASQISHLSNRFLSVSVLLGTWSLEVIGYVVVLCKWQYNVFKQFRFYSWNTAANTFLLTSTLIQWWFCPPLMQAPVWVWAGSRTVGENVTSSTQQLWHISRSSYFLCLSYTTYVGKSDQVSQLSQLCHNFDRSNHFMISQALLFCKASHLA